MNAVFLDSAGLDDLSLKPLEEVARNLEIFLTTKEEQVAERIAGKELVIVNKVKLSRDVLQSTPSLRMIAVVATGTDIIDLQAAHEFNITVCNCVGYGTSSVIQHVFAMILALQTNLPAYLQSVKNGLWQNSQQFCLLDFPIHDLSGKTLGVLGFGTLGKAVANVAKAFGMNILVARRPDGPPDNRPTLQELLPQVDILTLHCPLTDHTRNIINAKTLAIMKPQAFLINAARGGLVDEPALVWALQTKKIAGAAVDVLSCEPPRLGNPLLDYAQPNLIITPHIAWASMEARSRIIDQTIENIKSFQIGKPVRVVV